MEDVSDKATLGAMITRFREDYREFFAGGKLRANISQMYWYRLQLMRNRLDSRKVTMDVQFKRSRSLFSRGIGIKRVQDGKISATIVDEPVNVECKYWMDGYAIGGYKRRETATYTITEAMTRGNAHICPNCGAEQPMENLLDGCDYCDTKFQMDDFGRKIASFSLGRSVKDILNGIIGKYIILMVLICVASAVWGFAKAYSIAITDVEFITAAILGLLASFYSIFMIGTALIFAFIAPMLASVYLRLMGPVLKSIDRGVNKSSFEQLVREHDPLFSLQRFIGNVENKLAAIHFADGYKDVSTIAICDVSKEIRAYTNVLEVVMERFTYQAFRISGDYQYVDMQVAVELVELADGDIKKRQELISLTLMKSKYTLTQELCEVTAFKCKGCGASVGLEVGKCEYCGTKLELDRHDWVISSYRIG